MRTLPLVMILAAACSGPNDDDAGTAAPWVPEDLVPSEPDRVVDINAADDVYETHLSAREANIDIGGGEVVKMLTYGAQLPGPELRVQQGDRVIVHLDNELPDDFPTTIHWHGIEGTNAADGTPTTQGPILPGDRFTYDFRVPRPGIYWFHPHIRGAQTTHSGLYGTLVVEDPDEPALIEAGILPTTRYTWVLSDLSVYQQAPVNTELDDDFALMNGTEGEHLLINGEVMPTYDVPAGEGVRLQLLNTSITRYWRVSVPGHTIYRVGGENGLLEHVRVEGGSVEGEKVDRFTGEVLGTETIEHGYERGELLLGPAERADVVIVPNGEVGDEIVVRWEDFARGRHGMWMEGDVMMMGDALDDGLRPGHDVAKLRIVEGSGASYALAEGDPVLAAVGRRVQPIDDSGDILDFTDGRGTELGESMEMVLDEDGKWIHLADFFIDNRSWMPDPMAGPSQPIAPNARVVKLGDRILWEVHNTTMMSHPFHLHGFSYQPVEFRRYEEEEEDHRDAHDHYVRWPVEHVEFEDTTHIPSNTSLVFLVDIADPNGDGGAIGRWMKHCHIFQHGESGMMSELVVEP